MKENLKKIHKAHIANNVAELLGGWLITWVNCEQMAGVIKEYLV